MEQEKGVYIMSKTINYKGESTIVRGGAWLDTMNSCFYEVIDSVYRYDICREYSTGEIFALPNPDARPADETTPRTPEKIFDYQNSEKDGYIIIDGVEYEYFLSTSADVPDSDAAYIIRDGEKVFVDM